VPNFKLDGIDLDTVAMRKKPVRTLDHSTGRIGDFTAGGLTKRGCGRHMVGVHMGL
jgi:hypothetical protein